MTLRSDGATDALWRAMVEHAEIIQDAVVLGQRRASAKSARLIEKRASELAALAQAAGLLQRSGRAAK